MNLRVITTSKIQHVHSWFKFFMLNHPLRLRPLTFTPPTPPPLHLPLDPLWFSPPLTPPPLLPPLQLGPFLFSPSNSVPPPSWCGVAQLVARRLAGRQARVRFPARHHREVFPTEQQAMRKWRKASANVLYECDWMIVLYECYKNIKINKKPLTPSPRLAFTSPTPPPPHLPLRLSSPPPPMLCKRS